ncbi:NADH:flavin oxidoreductase, Old Yellow Enzyme family [Hoeflea phototrophica DFL-43]|jgi:2,4-dienoyl-CoA reductase-like NADH-dependent reductase (Old Yellow Enzyme family)|uniref:NADH:flavin oxidoreductase, Old Yellow Enzyme family n=1 Tax=Hoeflea phototrophica (strain DSM 17068 / NCIMB 14078 / DFL-43) TaxID=411684 RepID=A9DB78_HOEPD|nr:NADH:flavin oxidoreductase/NADH oxidase family protein [Hoeflea phototrophica]EDQ32460.1 NADH:flavin oxidoreductase, Old Yellow Enzyme family [Hoeflea phototrophica DFL-43]
MSDPDQSLFEPLTLPCGITLKNRISKSAMSDSLGDGTGHPTAAQIRLYERWAEGGAGLSIIGEVQADPGFAEKPGNLVLNHNSDLARFHDLTRRGTANGMHLWPQLGHAGAMAYPPISNPKGPSALDLPGLAASAMTADEIAALPAQFAQTAKLAQSAGFTGVQVHAAHGFLLSQFLSPLFNRREDGYGGSIENRMRLLLEVIDAVRNALGPDMPIAVKLNATDQLEGGLGQEDALTVAAALDATGIDLLDISGGTYFPGAKSASDSGGKGPYFLDFAKRARQVTRKPLMATGGFKTLAQASDAVSSGTVDMVGLARALALEPGLPALWQQGKMPEPAFPRFQDPPEGGVTAWYTMCLTAIGENGPAPDTAKLDEAIAIYEARDRTRTDIWRRTFG